MRRLTILVLVLIAAALLVAAVSAQSGGSFTLVRSVVGSGGTQASGGDFTLNGTVGQAAVGLSFGGNFGLSSGFWTAGLVVPTAVGGVLGFSAESPLSIPFYLIALCTLLLTYLAIRNRKPA